MKIKERDITKAIRDYLTIKGIFHWKNWGGPMSKKGLPDIMGIMPDGKALFIEVKTETGKVSDHQQAFLREASANNAWALVARSVQDVIDWGI